MRVHACTFQQLNVCVATASRGHANHTRGPFKLWVICTINGTHEDDCKKPGEALTTG